MLKTLVAGFVVLLVVGMTGAWFVRVPDRLPARFGAGDCRRVELIDPRTGRAIVGAEDLALAPDGDMLIVSAHDRRDDAMPNGGLYSLGFWEIGGRSRVEVRALDGPRATGAVFRPHGIALSPDGARLAVINRISEDAAVVETGPLDGSGWHPERVFRAERLCRANDMAWSGNGTLGVTLDRADCQTSISDLLPWSMTGAVGTLGGGTLGGGTLGDSGLRIDRRDLGFANGLDSGGAVAETRRHRLSWPDGRRLDLPGGPDNLTRTPKGALIVAVHPNLFRLFAAQRGWIAASPSRILRVDPAGKGWEVLFDDPEGRMFSGATVAVVAGGALVIGSATDRGILLCEARG